MEIKVFGTGCAKCKKLEKNTRKAVQELGINADIVKISDIDEISKHNIMLTPALTVNGKLILSGSSGSVDKIKNLFK